MGIAMRSIGAIASLYIKSSVLKAAIGKNFLLTSSSLLSSACLGREIVLHARNKLLVQIAFRIEYIVEWTVVI